MNTKDKALTSAQKKRVEENINLAYHAVWKAQRKHNISKQGLEMEDAMQGAALSLCLAAKFYDENRGVAFTTYGTTSVMSNLYRTVMPCSKKIENEIAVDYSESENAFRSPPENMSIENIESSIAIASFAKALNKKMSLKFDCTPILKLWAEYGKEKTPPRDLAELTGIDVKEIYLFRNKLKRFVSKSKHNRQFILDYLA